MSTLKTFKLEQPKKIFQLHADYTMQDCTFSRTFALQIGHFEFCLLQLLQTAQRPHGKNTTEAFD